MNSFPEPDGGPALRSADGAMDPFRELVENSLRGVAVVRGRRCVYCNPAFARLFGRQNPAEVLAIKDLFQLVAAPDVPQVLEHARRFAKADPAVPAHIQFRAERPDGAECWVELDLRNTTWEGLPALHVTGRDITEQKAVEASRNLLSTAAEQAQEAIYMTDVTGRILYANPTAVAFTGYPAAEVLGANPRKFKSGQHDAAFYQELWKTLLAGRMWSGRLVNRRKDGSLIELDTRISPVRGSLGQVTHFIGIQSDVTRTVVLEGQLRQAEKMETLGQLAGGIAHDFNNLLQVISGWTLLLMEDGTVGNAHCGQLEHIHDAVRRAAGLTQQLLAMSRKGIPCPRTLDLNALVSGQMALLGSLLGAQVDLRCVTDSAPLLIRADPGMMEQVVMNLCVNGRDAMPAGGNLLVETRHAEFDEDFCRAHDWARPGAFAHLSVSDSGTGMTPEVQQRIFEPFFTTKEAGKGTGLGLATVMNIAQHHQALLRVQSEPGAGSTFHVYFPMTGALAAPAPMLLPEAPRAGRGESILVVEDDAAVGEFMREALQRGGYRVDHAPDGQAAVDLFMHAPAPYDVVVLDMVLPKLTGRQVFERIHGLRPATRFLFSSGYSPHAVDVEFVRQRNLPFIQKPYAPAVLLTEVGRMLEPSVGTGMPSGLRR